jgi:N-acetylglucosaminyldiphosphoundecaprenol N-acetyl-beta-D-mannosaminyltransferase
MIINKRAEIGCVGVDSVNINQSVDIIARWIAKRERHYVCLCNVRSIACSCRDKHLRGVFARAGLVVPDGMPLVWALRWHGCTEAGRVYGPDLLLALCQRSCVEGYRHFFYGGAPGVAERLSARLKAHFAELQIVGTSSPPFRPLREEEDRESIAHINQSGADIVWVGLGAPKQELWMADHRALLAAPVLLGVGYAFDVHSGTKAQAPRWMQRSGLEWAFRFSKEPFRLWPRIVVDGPVALLAFLSQMLRSKRVRHHGHGRRASSRSG